MGLLLVKELILIDKNAGTLAGEVRMRGLPYLKVLPSLTSCGCFQVATSADLVRVPEAASVLPEHGSLGRVRKKHGMASVLTDGSLTRMNPATVLQGRLTVEIWNQHSCRSFRVSVPLKKGKALI